MRAWCYRIVFGLTVLKFDEFFQRNPATQTRVHAFKLYKRNCTHRSRSVFFQSVLLMYGTNYPFQLILDHYPRLRVVSAVLTYRPTCIYNFCVYCV